MHDKVFKLCLQMEGKNLSWAGLNSKEDALVLSWVIEDEI